MKCVSGVSPLFAGFVKNPSKQPAGALMLSCSPEHPLPGGQGDRFHRRGAAEQKARSPMVFGTRGSELLVDLRVRVEEQTAQLHAMSSHAMCGRDDSVGPILAKTILLCKVRLKDGKRSTPLPGGVKNRDVQRASSFLASGLTRSERGLPSHDAIFTVPVVPREDGGHFPQLTASISSQSRSSINFRETSFQTFSLVITRVCSYVVFDKWKRKHQTLPPPRRRGRR
ncbi:unnamed protein product [Pleuronectes platessa]|uniref:Uncharacterized protein n=1 Tax=Pleuronectes platessa TaxID=8262 RepID=A0A9N7VI45_PLEPL|nr:unnamed protein product [Pleuronectes platessa]